MPRISEEIPEVSFVYRLVRWIFSTVLAIFFQEIDVVGKENVPRSGPVIFVGKCNVETMLKDTKIMSC